MPILLSIPMTELGDYLSITAHSHYSGLARMFSTRVIELGLLNSGY